MACNYFGEAQINCNYFKNIDHCDNDLGWSAHTHDYLASAGTSCIYTVHIARDIWETTQWLGGTCIETTHHQSLCYRVNVIDGKHSVSGASRCDKIKENSVVCDKICLCLSVK